MPIIESTAAPGFTLTTRGGKSSATFTAPADLIAYSGSEQPRIDINAPVIFVGYGIVAPEYKWNDYEGVDMKGKVVMVMVNDPPAPAAEPTLFGGKALTYYGRWTYKFEEAARQGAAGAILIHTDESATYPWRSCSRPGAARSTPSRSRPAQPVLGLKAWMTERGGAQAGRGRRAGSRRAAQGGVTRGAKAVDLGVSVEGALQQTVARKMSPNVIGVLKGANAEPAAARGGESVIYSAHYDHIGIKPVKDDEGRCHLQRRARQRVGRRRHSGDRRSLRRNRTPARAIDLFHRHDRRRIRTARLGIFRDPSDAGDRQGGREYQHRRVERVRDDAGARAARRRAIGPARGGG